MYRVIKLRRTTIITLTLLAFLAGLGLARTGFMFSIWLVVIAAIFFVTALKRQRPVALLAAIMFGLSFGWWRGSIFMQRLRPYQEIQKQTVVLEVIADTDGIYNDTSQLSFEGSHVHIIEPFDTKLPGKVTIAGFGATAVYRGDVVRAEGKFYPTRGSKQGTISFGDMQVLGRSDSFVNKLRLRFAAGMQTALPEPLASFGLGLLIGQRSTLPDVVNKQLSMVGLTHIIAVSGYNLTIIIRAVRRFGKKRSKYETTVISLSLIIGFLLVTGFSASIVRAAIVSGLSLIAWYYGRAFRPLLLLSLAAVITAGYNPLYLWSDIGWYLSFLAFYGVIVIVPLITRRLFNKKEPKPLTALLLETTSAQLMTMPLVLYIFGQASMVALLSNLLVVPLVPIAMLLALFAGLSGMFVSVLAGWIAWPAKMLLTYMLDVVTLFSRIPHAAVERNLPLMSMIALYISLALMSFVLWRKSLKNARITDKETMEY